MYIVFNLSVGFRLIQVIRTVVAFLFKFFFSVFFFDGPKMLSHAAQHIFIFWFILKYGGLLWLKFTAVTKIRKYFDTYLYEYWNILTHNVTRNSPFNRKIKHLDHTDTGFGAFIFNQIGLKKKCERIIKLIGQRTLSFVVYWATLYFFSVVFILCSPEMGQRARTHCAIFLYKVKWWNYH